MKKIVILLIFFFVCVFEYGFATKELKDEDVTHEKCLTWDDNETTLKLTCRLPRLSSFVKFYHKESKTNVKCNMVGDTLSCNPRDKIIHTFRNRKQIIVMLHESKTGKDLGGNWFCQTNKRTMKATVNLIKGIVTDLWVKIRGSVKESENGDINLSIECSSCRRPFRNYTEIYINNQSSNGIRLNEFGACILGNGTQCHPNQCNCSDSGNMFMISYGYLKLGTNITCSMHFKDKYRKGKFQVTVNATFNGTDFSFNSTKIFHTIKKPILITTPGPTESGIITEVKTTVYNKIQDEQEYTYTQSIIIAVASAVGSILIFCMIASTSLLISLKRQKTPVGSSFITITYHCNTREEKQAAKDIPWSSNRQHKLKSSHDDYDVHSQFLEECESSEKQDSVGSSWLSITYHFNKLEEKQNVVFWPSNIPNELKSSHDDHDVHSPFLEGCESSEKQAVNENDVNNTENNEFITTNDASNLLENRENNKTVAEINIIPNHEKSSDVIEDPNANSREVSQKEKTSAQDTEQGKSDVPSDEYLSKFSSPRLKRHTKDNRETKANGDLNRCKICHKKKIFSKSDFYCLNCGFSICLYCHNTHANFPDTEKHNRIPIDKIPDTFTGSSMCDHHTEEKNSYFCQDHKTVLCRLCSDQEHSECTRIPIEELSTSDIIEKELNDLNVKFDTVRNKIKKTSSDLKSLGYTKENTKSDSLTDYIPTKQSLQDSNAMNKKDSMDENLFNNHEELEIQDNKTEFEMADIIGKSMKFEDSLKQLDMFEKTDKIVCMALYKDGSYIDAFIQINKLLQKLDLLV